MFDLGLAGAHTLITGASGGIGLATAKAFQEQDALVSAHFNTQEQPLIDAFGRDHERVCRVRASVESEEEVERMFADARAKFGKGVEVLVGRSSCRTVCCLSGAAASLTLRLGCAPPNSQPRLHRFDRLCDQGHAPLGVDQDAVDQPDWCGIGCLGSS
jgi:NAD(P)-dependent dehydrogenase (short-subunit alcohol dehydrogenase family)